VEYYSKMTGEEAIKIVNKITALKNKRQGNHIVMKMLKLGGDDFSNVDFEDIQKNKGIEESTMGDIEEDDFGETVNGVIVKNMKVISTNLEHLSSVADESSESESEEYDLTEEDTRDPILRKGGIKIYPWYG